MTSLKSLSKSRLTHGTRFVFYGPEAVGKSSLAACAPEPIFIDCEDGTAQLEVARYPFRDGPGGHVPESLVEVYKAIEALSKQEHGFKTLVIDTMDALESLLHEHILARDSSKSSELNKSGKRLDSIESYGYGKGHVVAVEEWRSLMHRLDLLRTTTGMSVVLLGHATIKLYKNPEGEDYDRFQLRVNEKAAGFIKGWADVVGFCSFEEGGGKLDAGQTKAKGWSTGRRLLRFSRTATYDAKSRLALPPELELSPADPWAPLAAAALVGTAPKIVDAIAVEVRRIGNQELSGKVIAAVAAAGDDVAVLSRYLTKLQSTPTTKESTNV